MTFPSDLVSSASFGCSVLFLEPENMAMEGLDVIDLTSLCDVPTTFMGFLFCEPFANDIMV